MSSISNDAFGNGKRNLFHLALHFCLLLPSFESFGYNQLLDVVEMELEQKICRVMVIFERKPTNNQLDIL